MFLMKVAIVLLMITAHLIYCMSSIYTSSCPLSFDPGQKMSIKSPFVRIFSPNKAHTLNHPCHHAGTQPRLCRMEAPQLQCEGASVCLLHPEPRQ
ncbi:hypothetical protein FR483_n301L [Paramecium bursaria Chlorella virus FR483]|uniref:Uncharacterized protein n301L n=1 Tax=Paramecium bursaria Chlorella virus FR483 TaxID=399781 RepID=A7J705_PBCVF|nr:hypothetical protein FR483_n301L [Paramecium bursaria Chlorella virus FR483]ABT15586.1 hypothetical protein FR483_n301L [Paramecium bursaria Chlorella virus FR483]